MSVRPMRFKRTPRETPEINLIAFIDVLLVILIFLVLSSSYSNLTQVQVTLPVADTQAAPAVVQRINLAVSADGRYAIGNEALATANVRGLAERLHNAKQLAEAEASGAVQGAAQGLAARSPGDDILLVISADASASHQAVILAMTAANRAGLQQITFMSQRSPTGKPRPASP